MLVLYFRHYLFCIHVVILTFTISLGEKQLTERFFVCGFFYIPPNGHDVCAEAGQADIGIFHAFAAVQISEKRYTCFGRSGHSFHLKRYRDMERPLDCYYS